MKKQRQRHCHITGTITDPQTGERRHLSAEEIAEMLKQVLAIPIEERIKMSLNSAGESLEEKK